MNATRCAGAALIVTFSASACRLNDLTNTAPPVPGVSVATQQVTDSATVGSRPAQVTPIVLSAPGGATLDWSARMSTPAPWLAITPASGHAPAGRDTLTVSVNPAGLLPGTYDDTIVVSAAGDTVPSMVGTRLVVLDCGVSDIAIGQSVTDSLATTDCQPGASGSFARRYRFAGSAGDSVSIQLSAASFTPFAALADSATPGQPLAQGACGTAPACLRYIALRGAGPLLVVVRATQAGVTGPFTLGVRRPAPPDSVRALAQRRADGSAAPPGTTINDSSVTLQALGSDADAGDSLTLDVEVRPVTSSFTGVPTARSGLLPPGLASLAVAGLADGSYHWQARVTDETGRSGPWVPFDANGVTDFAVQAPANALAIRSQPPNATAGAVLQPAIAVAAVKPGGQTDTMFTGPVTLTLQGAPAGAALGGTVTRSAVRGVATFDDLHVDRAGSGYTLMAQTSGLSSTTSATFTVSPAAATRLAVTTQPGNAAAGIAIAPAPAVAALDAFGNTATAFTGTVTAQLQGGTAGATLSGSRALSASQGAATFSDLRVDKSGTGYQLSVTAPGLSATQTASFSITAGAASSIAFLTQPSDARTGQAIAPAVRVQVLDAFGNIVTSFSGTVHVALGRDPNLGLSVLSGTLTVAVVNGVATFSDLSINLPGSGFTLVMTAAALPNIESATFNESL